MKLILILSLIFGGEVALANESKCPDLKSAYDVVVCASSFHPKVRRIDLVFEQTKLLKNKAEQVLNPELDLESVFGRSSASSMDVGLLLPIELGGKRSSRIKMAESEIGVVSAELKIAQAEVILETVRHLHRLRQIEMEKKVAQEEIQALQGLIQQQARRPHLNPEQRVGLSVYRMALADATLRASEAVDEELDLENFFLLATGHSLKQIVQNLPEAPAIWPEVNDLEPRGGSSPAFEKAEKERSYQLAEVAMAKAEAWPTLRLGPMAKFEKAEGESESFYGFQLTMDLPVFNRNSGGKAFAQVGLENAEKSIAVFKFENEAARNAQLKIYQRAVKSLSQVPDIQKIEKEFRSHQRIASQGLVSSSLVTELHRQRAELIRSVHSREMKAIEALWQIYSYDGRIFQESL